MGKVTYYNGLIDELKVFTQQIHFEFEFIVVQILFGILLQ